MDDATERLRAANTEMMRAAWEQTTDRERKLMDIVGRATLAANEMSSAMLAMLAFLMEEAEPAPGSEGTQLFSPSDVPGILDHETPEVRKTFGASRRARTTEQPPQERVNAEKPRA